VDLAMLASSCVLLATGAGAHSIDAWLLRRVEEQAPLPMIASSK